MHSLEDLETPAVLVDLDILERNIASMAASARDHGVRLRPHGKTHKVPQIGRMQLAAGAAGLSLSKTSEAEVFAEAGFTDIFLAYPILQALTPSFNFPRPTITDGTDSVAAGPGAFGHRAHSTSP